MPTNKNAYLRYQVIDQCLGNPGRRYSFQDLLKKVNVALLDSNDDSEGIKVRQLRNDLATLKAAPFNAPIEVLREGRYHYYTYTDKDFSINKVPLNESETQQLQQTVQMLERFIGNENFAWLNELTPVLKDRLGIKNESAQIISLETDEYNKGKEFITQIFNAAVNKRVIRIDYSSFDNENFNFDFHPYHLKRANNRWFALGRNQEYDNPHWVVPLDRINSIGDSSEVYIDYQYNWDEHFQDFIGVTKMEGIESEKVILRFSKKQGKYVETKPIHGSQISKWLDENTMEVTLDLIPNFELEKALLSFGDGVEVIKPASLRVAVIKTLKSASAQYS